VLRFAQLEVDQLRSVAFVDHALQFGRMTFIGADPNNASRAYSHCLFITCDSACNEILLCSAQLDNIASEVCA